jgi:hypothetical protein
MSIRRHAMALRSDDIAATRRRVMTGTKQQHRAAVL